ncbi:MAG: cytochrome c [Verrucomicrobiae bacterium]|nr:cytochrome c [Verrucomicrobiae bacterium]
MAARLDQTSGGSTGGNEIPKAAVLAMVWLIVPMTLSVVFGAFHVIKNGGGFSPFVYEPGETLADVQARVPRDDSGSPMRRGRRVYGTCCAACHQWHGRGVPDQFPPLMQSEWVLASGPNRLIRIVLDGMEGPITVLGREYNNPMLPWRDVLTDEDVAAVLTFIRNNKQWNHSASAVSPEHVARVRIETSDRSTYWTAGELNSIPESD